MSKKILKTYSYTGLGFPIELYNVETISIRGEFHPKIDIKKLADFAIKSLVTQETRLTGNQIKFIRSYFSMSLRDFAKIVNTSHTAIKKWESFLDHTTHMDVNIEIMLRLYIYDKISKKTTQKKNNFYHHYLKLTKTFLPQQSAR